MKPKTLVMLIVSVFLGLSAFATSCTVIDAGEVGVQKNFGAVQAQPLREGLHFVLPYWLSSVPRVDVKARKATAEASASSKDMQIVSAVVDVNFSARTAMAPKIVQRFGSVEALAHTVLAPGIQETLKAVTARYSAEELIKKRSEVKKAFETELNGFITKSLQSKGVEGAIEIANVAVADFNFSKEFNDAIEAKVRTEQEALKAQNEKTKRITEAEAAAAEKRESASAEAFSIEAKSKARAEAITREAKALKSNPELIELRKIERWNGQLPRFTGDLVPMLRLD